MKTTETEFIEFSDDIEGIGMNKSFTLLRWIPMSATCVADRFCASAPSHALHGREIHVTE